MLLKLIRSGPTLTVPIYLQRAYYSGSPVRVAKRDIVLSGGFGTSSNSARSGYIPICVDRVPLAAFEGISIHLRSKDEGSNEEKFRLYCSANVQFTPAHLERLKSHDVKFIYIQMADQSRFRLQTEETLLKTVEDPSLSVSVKSEIVYETSVELVNELLSEADFASKSERLEKVSRAVTTLVLNDPTAFSHLFAASHHDFYTATHMVNVATWMVPLAYAMGYHDVDELNHICEAGLMHDVGKVYIPPETLNKKGKLTDEEWAQIKRHPELGYQYLQRFDHINSLVPTVAHEHHERLDGTGYPRGCKGDQIHPISKICAVIDSFDAMTAFRPFKERTMSVAQAMSIIVEETPAKYDEKVVEKWMELLQSSHPAGLTEPVTVGNDANQRQFPRFPINCPARLHVLQKDQIDWVEKPGLPVIAHNISRSGAGFVSQQSVQPGETVRLYFQGKGTLERVNDGMVVRSRVYRDGWNEIGMKFAAAHAIAGGPDVPESP